MVDLTKYTELTEVTFDHDNAGLAICHVSQGYGANGRPDALILKSSTPVTAELIKSLENVYDKETLIKMTADNKRRYLESLVTAKLKESFPDKEYVYCYVVDFSDDMVAFNFEDEGMWAVDYSEEEESGTILLGDSPRKVLRADVYIEADSGEVLIKANVFKELASESVVEELLEDGVTKSGETPITEEETLEMSDGTINEDLLKSDEMQELIKAAASEMAKTQFEELQKAKVLEDLEKSTTEIVKGFSGVVEDEVEGIVKCLVGIDQGVAGSLLKAMGDMQEALIQKDAEIEEVKKEFGTTQNAVEAEVEVVAKAGDRADQLASVVNKMKAKK